MVGNSRALQENCPAFLEAREGPGASGVAAVGLSWEVRQVGPQPHLRIGHEEPSFLLLILSWSSLTTFGCGKKAFVMSVMFTYLSALPTLFLRLCKSSGKRLLPACLKVGWRLRHVLKGTAEETSRHLSQVSEIWVPPESFCKSVK